MEENIPDPANTPDKKIHATVSEIRAFDTQTPETGKSVHVQISADIPEGMDLNIVIHAVNSNDVTNVTQELVASETQTDQITVHYTQGKTSLTQAVAKSARVTSSKFQPTQVRTKLSQWFSAHISSLKTRFSNLENINILFFLAAIVIYFLAVSDGIDRFPIYFFTDESIHANLASDLVNHGFKSSDGTFLPTYFSLGSSFGLNSLSVYLQVIPYILFGKSVIVTRMVSALITMFAAILVGLLLKRIFKVKSYWLGILLLITSPAWFLHARTAFEYMEVASFFTAMLYCYNRYRLGEDKFLYATILAAALTFYTHGLGELLAVLTAILFFISDFRYHFQPQRRRTLLIGVGLALILFIPYLRANLINSTVITDQIKQRGSYWVDANYTIPEKIFNNLKEYFNGVNPLFWFFNNPVDLNRHKMLGYSNILGIMLPFALLGIIRTIYKFRESEYRSILIALLVAPFPASIVAVGTPRVLWMIVPWTIIIALGIDWAMIWISSRTKFITFGILNAALFLLLASTSIFILRDALTNGPTWYTNYGLYGMQYGAKQVFQDVVHKGLEQDSNRYYVVSPTWANGTEQFVNFFIPVNLQNRVDLGQPEDFINAIRKDPSNLYFVATVDEYDKLVANLEYRDITVHQVLPYPNGKPGFYVLTLNVADNIEEILSAEHKKNRTPVEDTLSLNGQSFRVVHSPLGSGNLQDVFDNNPDTLARVIEANPDIFDLYPNTPLDTNSIIIQTGSLSNFTVTIKLYAPGESDPIIYTRTYKGLPPDPLVTIPFDKGPAKSARIYIEIKDNSSGETSQIHVRTLQLK